MIYLDNHLLDDRFLLFVSNLDVTIQKSKLSSSVKSKIQSNLHYRVLLGDILKVKLHYQLIIKNSSCIIWMNFNRENSVLVLNYIFSTLFLVYYRQ